MNAMKRTPIKPDLNDYPAVFRPILAGVPLYDSSCSPEARVIFIDRDGGYYLKKAAKGSLGAEAEMTAYFHSKGIGTAVLDYQSLQEDWLLTARARGEDCTHPRYLNDPKRLCDTLAVLLRSLHESDTRGCPVPNRMEGYFHTVEQNWRAGVFDPSFLPEEMKCLTRDEAFREVRAAKPCFQADTLLHGDYCLPNVMLDDWAFACYIDLGNGGVGDRHVDLFWGAWTLAFNLGTDRYRQRFFDAYGRDRVDTELLRIVGVCEAFG